MNIQVSVIIVNYNTRDLLENCIHSVLQKTEGVNFEIIVVDNASVDSSREMLLQEFPNVRLIASGENLGFGKANNLGVLQAKGECFFFLNSDTLLVNDAISILYDFMCGHQGVGICGGSLYDIDMHPNLSVVHPPLEKDEYYRLLSISSGENKRENNYDAGCAREVECITGADLMIKRELFLQVGGFDPDFFMYAEEVELTNRVKRHGYSVFIVPSAQIIHLEGRSARSIADNQRVYAEKLFSKWLYFWKVSGFYTARRIYWAYFLKSIFAYSFYSLSFNKKKKTYWSYKKKVLKDSYSRFIKLYYSRVQ